MIELRTYQNAEEIRVLPGFLPDNPVDGSNFSDIRCDYRTEKEEFECCYRYPNGTICRERHKYGFLAELKDRTLTVVGNDCARKKLGASDKFVRTRIAKYKNDKDHAAAVSRLARLTADRDARQHSLRIAVAEIQALAQRMKDFKKSLGPYVTDVLEKFARDGYPNIMVRAVTIQIEKQPDGKEKRVRLSANHTIGSLKGMRLLLPSTFNKLVSAAAAVDTAYNRAESLSNSARTRDIVSLAVDIESGDRVVNDCKGVCGLEELFRANDLALLCYLVNRPDDRSVCLRVAHGADSDTLSQIAVRQLLDEMDRGMAERLRCDSVEFPTSRFSR